MHHISVINYKCFLTLIAVNVIKCALNSTLGNKKYFYYTVDI